MIYDDGVQVDNQMRVTQCPRCENEVFGQQAEHCKICGLTLYNLCEGEYMNDYGHEEVVQHRNPGDARFCETCGKPTEFYKEQILQPWEVVQKSAMDFQQTNQQNIVPFNSANNNEIVEDPFAEQSQASPPNFDDLPF